MEEVVRSESELRGFPDRLNVGYWGKKRSQGYFPVCGQNNNWKDRTAINWDGKIVEGIVCRTYMLSISLDLSEPLHHCESSYRSLFPKCLPCLLSCSAMCKALLRCPTFRKPSLPSLLPLWHNQKQRWHILHVACSIVVYCHVCLFCLTVEDILSSWSATTWTYMSVLRWIPT